MKIITAILISLISFVTAAMGQPDVFTNLHRRDQANLVLPGNSGQLLRHDAAAVNGLIQLSAQPALPVTIHPSALHILPESILVDYLLPHLSFKEAMNLADKRLTEEDIITHCDKSNAEEIINYIFRDLGSSDHGITDEVRLKNFRILLNSEQFQEQIQKDHMAAVQNVQMNPNLTRDLLPQRARESLQAAVNDMAQNGKLYLLRELLEHYSDKLSQVSIPHKAIFIAAEKGDSRTVDLILGKVRSKQPLSILNTISHDYEYIQNALRGSISGEQFEIFKQMIHLSNQSGRIVKFLPNVIVRDLLNKNHTSWLDYALSNSQYIIDTEKVIECYVRRSELWDGNPSKPSLENLLYLMHLPDYYYMTVKSFISIMFVADFDILEHLARQLLDPYTRFVAQNYITVRGKKRIVDTFVFGMEALNHAIDMVNEYKSKRYNHVRYALEKVKGEFDSLQK
jgi:hypothetical protein